MASIGVRRNLSIFLISFVVLGIAGSLRAEPACSEQRITLEEAHYRMSALPAHAAGFRDRGVLREGACADVVVYDLDSLGIEPEWIGEIVHDLPGGEWRRVQRPKGYRSIIVNGVETFSEGKCTDETPGKLLRHGHA